jgi:hypothetical protein
MPHEDSRRLNQEQLLELASVYRGFDRKRLAEALGRDATKLFPPTGNPKLDYLVSLADILDWTVGDVADAILDADGASPNARAAPSFDELNAAAKDAHRTGDFAGMLRIAQQMAAIAASPEQRALAALRESGGCDGLGRYTKQLEAVRRGLRESPISYDLRLLLQVNLANTYYTLWHLLEARGMARELIDTLARNPPASRSARAAQAFAHYVAGSASRCLIAQEPDQAAAHAAAAKESLATAFDLYTRLAEEFNHDPWRGIANTCRGGLIEVEAELGERKPLEAVEAMLKGLDGVVETDGTLAGDRLESFGWWCIMGCNIALRHLGGRDLQRHMAVFTNKGYEIAERLDNWAMRERLFTLEFLQRQRLNDLVGFPVEWTIDNEEVRLIVGTMGRFPAFRGTGWRILRTATVVKDN